MYSRLSWNRGISLSVVPSFRTHQPLFWNTGSVSQSICFSFEPREHPVEVREGAADIEGPRANEAIEPHSGDELHHENGLRARREIERDEAREVRVLGQREQRARLLAEQLHELLLRELARCDPTRRRPRGRRSTSPWPRA